MHSLYTLFHIRHGSLEQSVYMQIEAVMAASMRTHRLILPHELLILIGMLKAMRLPLQSVPSSSSAESLLLPLHYPSIRSPRGAAASCTIGTSTILASMLRRCRSRISSATSAEVVDPPASNKLHLTTIPQHPLTPPHRPPQQSPAHS